MGAERRPLRRSLRVRITAISVVAAAAVLAFGGLAMVAIQRSQLIGAVDDGLREDLREVAIDAEFGGRGFRSPVDRRRTQLYQVVGEDGAVLDRAPMMQDLEALVDEIPTDGLEFSTVEIDDRKHRIVAVPVRANGQPAALVVADDLSDTDEAIRRLVGALVVSIPALVAVMGGLIWFVTGRALRPVDALRREVDAITVADLGRRVDVPDSSDELAQLASTMNRMLGRLDASVQRQRRFVGDASHELRSPLAGIRSELEVNLAHPEQADWDDSGRRVLDETVRLQHLVDQLLLLARGDARASQRVEVDVDDLVFAEAGRLRGEGVVTVDASGVSAARVLGDPIGLGQVVRNLSDNAARHAVGAVTFTVAEGSDGWVEVAVSDDGPGVPADDAERIFERFARVDEARARASGGAGLGLAISRAIVEGHGGTISLATIAPAGARFVVRLPSASSVD
ncbi:MAG: ATP-binding protein [Actinomycetota bacterium]